jgi:hypothetical protein
MGNGQIKKKLLRIEIILLIVTTIIALKFLYDTAKDAHQGEFCNFKSDNKSYQFILHGRKCDFSWDALSEPLISFVFIHIVIQTLFWLGYGFVVGMRNNQKPDAGR